MILEKFNLNGKTAIVTGANRGIGQYYSMALAEAGADIIGVSNETDFAETEKLIKPSGKNLSTYVCDMSSRSSLYDLINKLNSDFTKIDILVNNAGIIRIKLIYKIIKRLR